MPLWKRILLRSFGFGAGFGFILCAIGGLWLWHESKPKPQAPWNKEAISAEYDYIGAQGNENNLAFYYVLQNNTDFDYRINSDAGIDITARLKQQKGLGEFAGRYVTTGYPIFVPAKSRARIAIDIPYPYPHKEKSNSTTDEHKQFLAEAAKYVAERMSNLGGFALFDGSNRYQIDFPSGWEETARQAPTSK